MANKHRDPQREALWRKHLAKHAASGLSVRAFCRHQELTESAFYAWRRTIRERDAEGKSPTGRGRPSKQPAFVPVVVWPESPSEASLAVELAGGRILRLPGSMPVERLAELVQALEARSER